MKQNTAQFSPAKTPRRGRGSFIVHEVKTVTPCDPNVLVLQIMPAKPRVPRQRKSAPDLIICPFQEAGVPTHRRAQPLSDTDIKDIEQQITDKNYPGLPSLGIGKRFYKCPDCNAVWTALSAFERPSKESVCGTYNIESVWKPYQ